ncbi:DUF4129 domain-containing protein [Saccharibacillus alkalitolerans]|uniref:DUF4129 domain-containing protein n=1 Tax=Saccharibacillus alkalitolerans TaxID=2705290 RepID=A0ABX0F687_9BACL|nr:DUF4129 domain-containing protein [Saccharibacillus alkalitolerans]NGZ75910.1 DUF4129 domain-containing protein [Saccharibacillus alkalitolerans]
MKTNAEARERRPLLQGFGRPAAYSLLETMSVYAPAVLLAHYLLKLPDLLLLLPLLALHLCASLIGLRQAENRLAGWATLLPFAAALLLGLFLPGGTLVRGIGAAVLLLAALRGLMTGRRQLWDNMQLRIPLSGIAALLILYVYAGNTPDLENYRPLLYTVSVLLLALTLLLVNGDRVRDAAGQETSALGSVLTANRRLTWIVAALVVAAGLVGGPTGILNAIREWWMSIFAGPPAQPDFAPDSPLPAADYSQLGQLGESGETPLWLKAVGYSLRILFFIVLVIVIGWLLYRLFGRWLPNGLRNLIRKIAARFGLMREIRASQDGKNYTDKAEKLAEEKTGSKKRRFRFGRREPEYVGEDPRLRYRSVLMNAARKGFPFLPSRTPAENGRELSAGKYTELSAEELDRLVERYNHARYGHGEKRE